MKKLKIVLHKEKKENVLRGLLDEGSFQLENVEAEGLQEQGEATDTTVEAMSLLSKLEVIRGIFTEVGIKPVDEKAPVERVVVSEKTSEEMLNEIGTKIKKLEERVMGLYSNLKRIREDRDAQYENLHTLKALEKLNIDFHSVKEEYEARFNHVYLTIGSVPKDDVDALRDDVSKITADVALSIRPLSHERALVFLVSMKKFAEEISFVLSIHSFKKLDIPKDLKDFELHDAVLELTERIANLDIEEKKNFNELKEIGLSEDRNINVFRELINLEKALDEILTFFGRTVETYIIHGWVPVDAVYRVSDIIRKESDGLFTLEVLDPLKSDFPPSLIKNPGFAKPLEVITDSYGTPAYDEYDPTTLASITFPIIFGLMFGDVGQGLVIAIFGYILGFRTALSEPVRKAARTVMYAGICAFLVGFLYGAVFSIEGLFEPLWLSPVHAASENMDMLFGATLKFGVIMLTLAMLVHVANEVSHHKYLEAAVTKYGLAGIWMLLGGAVMISRHGPDLAALVTDPLIVPTVAIPLLIVFLGTWKVEGQSAMVSAVEAFFETLVKLLVNAISFMRIIILAIIHGALSLIMVGVMEMMPPTTLGTVGQAIVFVFMNIVIIVMELFVSFIQTMRLHYYEIFSKFYKGTGRPFRPLRFIRKYTAIDKKI